MDDLVNRLRSLARAEHDDMTVADEAADTIEQQQAEIERLREVLAPFALFARPAAMEIAGGDENQYAAPVAEHGNQRLTLGAFLEAWKEVFGD